MVVMEVELMVVKGVESMVVMVVMVVELVVVLVALMVALVALVGEPLAKEEVVLKEETVVDLILL